MKLIVSLIMGVALVQAANAVSVNLVTANSGTANGAQFVWIDQHSTGTGVIDPFLRLQGNNTEEGYNSSVAIGDLFADTKGGIWTHDLQLSAVPVVTIGGTRYYEFLLDINEQASAPLISLYRVELYLSGAPITAAAANGKLAYSDLADDGTLKWSLDSGPPNTDGDSTVELDFTRNPGSGWGDMFMYVPESALGTDLTKYLTLYSAFGIPNDTGDGFEEWALRTPEEPPPGVPDGGVTATLLGLGLLALSGLRRRLAK